MRMCWWLCLLLSMSITMPEMEGRYWRRERWQGGGSWNFCCLGFCSLSLSLSLSLQSTLLHLSAGYNRVRVVQLLLKNGADVHAKDKGCVCVCVWERDVLTHHFHDNQRSGPPAQCLFIWSLWGCWTPHQGQWGLITKWTWLWSRSWLVFYNVLM